jgi:hypothetical protein
MMYQVLHIFSPFFVFPGLFVTPNSFTRQFLNSGFEYWTKKYHQHLLTTLCFLVGVSLWITILPSIQKCKHYVQQKNAVKYLVN